MGGANGSAKVVMFVDCCVGGGWYFLYYSYSRNPTGREFFVPARTFLVVKLLNWDYYGVPLPVHFTTVHPPTAVTARTKCPHIKHDAESLK
jgi:hypothetical protein